MAKKMNKIKDHDKIAYCENCGVTFRVDCAVNDDQPIEMVQAWLENIGACPVCNMMQLDLSVPRETFEDSLPF